MIASSAHYAGLAGASAAGAITLAELAAPESGGTSLAAAAAAFVGELTSTTYIQLKMIYNISVVLGAPLDAADPEDLMTMFWYALGIQKWQEAANAVLSAGPRSTEYLGRKALRSGIRAAMQQVANKFGGQQLARQLTERACLRLLVPGVNMPLAYWANKRFTKKLGRIASTRLKHRAAIVPAVRNLEKENRDIQLLALPVIFHIGIALEESADGSRTIELQDTVTRKLKLSSTERDAVFDLIEVPYDEFLQKDGNVAISHSEQAHCATWRLPRTFSVMHVKAHHDCVRSQRAAAFELIESNQPI